MNSEQKIYKHLFENSGEGMLVTNKQGIIEIVNPSLLDLFGYTKEELIGQKIEILVPDSIKNSHHQHTKDYVNRPEKRKLGGGMDLLAKRKNGSEFSVEIGLNHCCIDDDLKVVAILSDITARVESDKKLKELNLKLKEKVTQRTQELEKSQKLYNLISRNFPSGIISVFDKHLNYVFTEGQELDRIGLSSKKLVGESYKKRFNKNTAILIKEKLAQVFDGGKISFEFEENDEFYVVNAVPLKDTSSNVEQALVIEKNITESKLAQQKVKDNLGKEIELNEMKSRFVSMASHEFRTPLSTIMSSASLVRKYQKEEQQDKRDKHINRIKTSVKNLTSILNDFLSIDKLEDGKIHISLSNFLLIDLLNEVIDEMGYFLKKGQLFKLNNTFANTQLIHSDGHVIKNILINLISNAIKYSSEGDKILINVTTFKKGLEIAIVDFGIGIPKKEQDKLFHSRFFRAGNVTNIEGTGLGLTIVKKYLSLIGGQISFISDPKKGSTFTITIPNILT